MRIFALDNDVLFRRCLLYFLAKQGKFSIAGQASSAKSIEDMQLFADVDIVLTDVRLDHGSGLDFAEKLISRFPQCAVIFLTAELILADVLRAIDIGAMGFISKSIDPEYLLFALNQVAQCQPVFPQQFLLEQIKNNAACFTDGPAYRAHSLTSRECEILSLAIEGLMDKQIAHRLNLSDYTVKNHMKNIRRKLGVNNRVQASIIGMQLGISAQDLV